MFSYLKALAARLGWRQPGGWPPALPEDPFAGVRVPKKRGPGGRSAAIALAEPDEPRLLCADGRGQGRGVS